MIWFRMMVERYWESSNWFSSTIRVFSKVTWEDNLFGVIAASKRFHTPPSTLRGYRKHLEEALGARITKGRPSALNAEAEESLINYLTANEDYKTNLNPYIAKIENLIASSAEQRDQMYCNKKNNQEKLKRSWRLNIRLPLERENP